MKFRHISVLVCCLLWHSASAYFTAEQLEQIEQKYESPVESEDQEFYASPEQAAAIETLSHAYSQLEPSQVKNYGESAGGIPQSLLSSPSSYSSASLNSPSHGSGLKSLEGKSSEYSKVTHIPSGSLFSMSDKGPNPLEFESPFSKQPYSIVFRTHSMPVKIKQQHQTLPAPEVEFVRSQEDAHRIKHEVVRPIIQEVHEIIQPYRRVVQEVRPVEETIHTIVSKGEGRGQQQQAGAGGNGGGGGRGSGAGGAGSYGGGAGHGGNGGLSVGYSENLPRYAQPQHQQQQQQRFQEQQHFRVATHHQPSAAQSQFGHSLPQYSSVARMGPSRPHYRSRY